MQSYAETVIESEENFRKNQEILEKIVLFAEAPERRSINN